MFVIQKYFHNLKTDISKINSEAYPFGFERGQSEVLLDMMCVTCKVWYCWQCICKSGICCSSIVVVSWDERTEPEPDLPKGRYEDVSNNSKNHHGHSVRPILGTDNNKHGYLTGLSLSLYCSHCITPGIDWSSTVKSKSTLVTDKDCNHADSWNYWVHPRMNSFARKSTMKLHLHTTEKGDKSLERNDPGWDRPRSRPASGSWNLGKGNVGGQEAHFNLKNTSEHARKYGPGQFPFSLIKWEASRCTFFRGQSGPSLTWRAAAKNLCFKTESVFHWTTVPWHKYQLFILGPCVNGKHRMNQLLRVCACEARPHTNIR